MPSISALKNDIMRLNNKVNMDLYGHGIKTQKVYLVHDEMIVIVADNKRISALAALDSCGYNTSGINLVLLNLFKKRLMEALHQELGLSIKSILKDYDNATQTAVTNIVLKEPLADLIP
jgi:hypothetical protein